jgi:nucleoside-diphosphate-sugar epimerase
LSPVIARFAGRLIELTYRLFDISAEPVITLFLAQQLSTAHWHDISAAKRDFGYEAEVSIEEGMEHLRAWISSAQKEESIGYDLQKSTG